MITAITIENFKGFRERVRLDLKPLTLIFGPNNAGKSTVLQAVHYAREILLRHNLDTDRTVSGGEAIDLGGFANFVHGRDLHREIRLRFDMSLSVHELPQLVDLSWELDEGVSGPVVRCVHRIDDQARSCWVELAVAWHEASRSPHVVECTTGFDGVHFGTIRFDPDRATAEIANIHFTHPLFSWRRPPDKFPEIVEAARECIQKEQPTDFGARFRQELEYRLRAGFSPRSGLAEAIEGPYVPGEGQQKVIDESVDLESKTRDSVLLLWYMFLDVDEVTGELDLDDLGGVTIPIVEQKDALPQPGRPLTLGYKRFERSGAMLDPDRLVRRQEPHDLNAILSHVLVSPVELLRKLIEPLRHLGPLRSIPGREYAPARIPDASRFVAGLSAWDSLAFGSDELVQRVDEWMGGDRHFKSGIHVRKKRFKEMSADSALRSPGSLADEFNRAPLRTQIVLTDAVSGLELRPQEVGVGISQLLPVVVSILDTDIGILAVEQPELHLHPRMQCEMGDLFIEGALGQQPKIVLIETHSEHLILRILRRVRETTRGHLRETIRVAPENVSVCFISQEDGCSVLRMIGIDEHGEFVVPWPDDFFESDFYERSA